MKMIFFDASSRRGLVPRSGHQPCHPDHPGAPRRLGLRPLRARFAAQGRSYRRKRDSFEDQKDKTPT
ncbi:hypothetical protein, partial [Pseudomonas putida]|uniref:hypothetical protein n=1 Tax=Pseudomonas putida TaxID=303 RepID=UPI001C0C9FA3